MQGDKPYLCDFDCCNFHNTTTDGNDNVPVTVTATVLPCRLFSYPSYTPSYAFLSHSSCLSLLISLFLSNLPRLTLLAFLSLSHSPCFPCLTLLVSLSLSHSPCLTGLYRTMTRTLSCTSTRPGKC